MIPPLAYDISSILTGQLGILFGLLASSSIIVAWGSILLPWALTITEPERDLWYLG